MRSEELVTRMRESATESLRLAGEVPPTVRAIALGWKIEPDPKDDLGRDGLRVTWRTYFDSEPTEEDLDFANDSSDGMVADIWRHLIWVEHESRVVPAHEQPTPLSIWLFHRNDDIRIA